MTYSHEYLQRLDEAVAAFQKAFEAWMETQSEVTHLEARGLFPTVYLREDAVPAIARQLELDVAEAAGTAARAVAVTGVYLMVAGRGAVDPISNWFTMSQPRAVLSPHEVRMTAASVRGRLSTMMEDAAVQLQGDLPAFAPAQLHATVWGAAASHWTTHQYRVAVREASEALVADWKERLGRADVDATVFWQETLSPGDPQPGRPKLRWPGEGQDKTVKSMRGGIEELARGLAAMAKGLNLSIRNPTTHSRAELSEQEAMERLSAYSFLARVLDQCEVVQCDD